MKATKEALDAINAARADGRVTERAAGPMPAVTPMTEEQFLRRVLLLARANGWRTAHFRPGRTKDGGWKTAVSGDGKGMPDLLCIRGSAMFVAELKVGRNKPTPEQSAWLTAFRAAGVRAFLWRPEDAEEIERVLGVKP